MPDDGVSVVPTPTGTEEKPMAVTDTILEQSFVSAHKRLDMIAERSTDSSSYIKARAEEQFLHESRIVGALAANRLDSGISDKVLNNRAAAGQPGNAPSGAAG